MPLAVRQPFSCTSQSNLAKVHGAEAHDVLDTELTYKDPAVGKAVLLACCSVEVGEWNSHRRLYRDPLNPKL